MFQVGLPLAYLYLCLQTQNISRQKTRQTDSKIINRFLPSWFYTLDIEGILMTGLYILVHTEFNSI